MIKNAKIRIIVKGLICDALIFAMQFGGVSAYGGSVKTRLSDNAILKDSELAYNAEGGFTGVQSYGVILSCVNGRVSVLKSIYDPRLSPEKAKTREIATMDPKKYLALWRNVDRHAIFKFSNCPQPTREIYDEFTVRFTARVGKKCHRFEVAGISRPIAARYYAIRELIDASVRMEALWDAHALSSKNVALAHE